MGSQGETVSYERGTPVPLPHSGDNFHAKRCPNQCFFASVLSCGKGEREGEFFIDDLLARIHFIIVMIRWIGLAPWEFEVPFSGSLTSTFLQETYAFISRFRAKREQLKRVQGLLPERSGQNLALTVLYVPYSLDSGHTTGVPRP